MHRLIFVSLLFISIFSLKLTAQMTYKQVDSTTYALFLKKDWYSLINFGEKAAAEGNDYFYFNLRVGIAYFNFKNYENSKKFLEKANSNNSYNKVTIEYLFWSNYHLLKEKDAKKWYAQLDDTTQQRINYIPKKLISSIYIGGGQKFSTDKNLANKVDYFSFALKMHLTGKVDITQSYTYLQQNLNWGNFSQHQYYANPIITFNKTFHFNLGFHYAKYESTLAYYRRDSYQSPPPMGFPGSPFIDSNIQSSYEINGTYNEDVFYFQPRITKTWNDLTLSPFLTYTFSNQQPNYSEHFIDTTISTEQIGSTIISQTTEYTDSISQPDNKTINQFGIGTGIYFNFERITFGSEFEYINRDNKSFFFISPYVQLKLSEKLSLSSYLFSKKNYSVSLFQASQLINSNDDVKKFSLTANYNLSKKVELYLTYQMESITDRLSSENYKLLSVYLGLNFKF